MNQPSSRPNGSTLPFGSPAQWWSGIMLAVGVGLTLFVWRYLFETERGAAFSAFTHETQRIRAEVGERMEDYELLLRAAQGFAQANPQSDLAAWRKLAQSLTVDSDFLKTVTLIHVRRIAAADLDDALRHLRRERPNFTIHPSREDDTHYPIVFAMPETRLGGDIGLDLSTRPAHREALERARDTGEAQITAPLGHGQTDELGRGLAMFLPIFADGQWPGDAAARREITAGWVGISFQPEPVLSGIAAEAAPLLHFEVFDGERIDHGRLIYDSDPSGLVGEDPSARFITTARIEVAGRVWTLAFATTPTFDQTRSGNAAWFVLAAGLALSLAMAASLYLAAGGQARAQALAERMAQAWRDSETNYSQIITGTAEGYWRVDLAGITLDVNDSLCRMLGFKRSDMIGRSCLDFVHDEDVAVFERSLSRVAISDHRRYDITLRNRDGGPVHTHFNATTVRNEQGEAVGSFAMISDVSARRKADEALRRSEERYRTVVETFPDAIIMHRDGKVIFVNPAGVALAGARSSAALIGSPVLALVHPEHAAMAQNRLGALGADMTRTPLTEMKFINAVGNMIEGEVTSTMVPFDNGTAIQTVVRDVTARKAAEAALRHRMALEHLMLIVSAALIEAGADELDVKLADALQALGEFAQVERAQIFLRGRNPRSLRCAFEWCTHDVTPLGPRLGEFGEARLPWLMERLRRFEVVSVANADELPAEARAERTDILGADTHALIAVPMRAGNELVGFLAMAAVHPHADWGQHDVGMLRLVAEIFAMAVERQAAERARLAREDEAREARQRLSDAIESIGDGFVLWDSADRMVVCNRRFREIYPGLEDKIAPGVTYSELINTAANRGLHAESRGREDDWVREQLDRHRTAQGSFEQRLADGRWIRVSERRTTGGGIVGIRSDISELKFREEELRESESRKGAIVGAALDAILTIDANGLVVDFNPSAERLFGYRRDEAMHRPLPELIIPPAYREAHRSALRRYLATGQGAIIGKRIEVPAINAKGVEFPIEITITVTGTERRPLFTAFLRDLSERRQAEESLRLAKAVFENTAEAILVTDVENRIQAVNSAFTAITGYGADEVIGQNPRLLSSGRHDDAFYRTLWNELVTKGRWEGEIWNRRKNGDVFPEWSSITVVKDEAGKVVQYVAVFTDITQRKENEALIWRRANFDALTGLPNRPAFMDRLNHAVERAKRGHGFALLFLDLDGFKAVNDRLGHAAGDDLLQEAGRRLQDCVRQADLVARLAGDEFTILLLDTRSASHVTRVAEKIIGRFLTPFILGANQATVGCSIGIARCPNDGETAEDLLAAADAAMYQVKRSGKNSYGFASPDHEPPPSRGQD